MLIFISGGVRSGKSSFAEKVAIENAKGSQIHYIATGKKDDDEMTARIERHRKRRRSSGVNWLTWEMPSGIHRLDKRIEKEAVVLLDCLTTWADNELFLDLDRFLEREWRKKVFASMVDTVARLEKNRTLIVVSNEVFLDVFPDESATLTYVEMLGKLQQTLVLMAETAYLCESGIPIVMKGEVNG